MTPDEIVVCDLEAIIDRWAACGQATQTALDARILATAMDAGIILDWQDNPELGDGVC